MGRGSCHAPEMQCLQVSPLQALKDVFPGVFPSQKKWEDAALLVIAAQQ